MAFAKVKTEVEDYLKNKAVADEAAANARRQSQAPDTETETRRNAFERGEVSTVSRGVRVTGGGAQWTPPVPVSESAPDWKSAPIETPPRSPPLSGSPPLPVNEIEIAAQREADNEGRRIAREAQREADAKVLDALVILENYVALCSADAHAKAVLLAREITRGKLARK